MNSQNAITRTLTRSPLIAVALYIAVAGGLLAIAGLAVLDIAGHRQALAPTSHPFDPPPRAPVAPLFLEGAMGTVAGAWLRQGGVPRVAIVGGRIQASLVDVLGTQ